MAKLSIIILLSTLMSSFCLLQCLDTNGVREGACISPPVLGMEDLVWMFTSKINKWYSPLASKYQVYKTAQEMLKKPMEEITEEELAKACLICTATKTIGFGGKSLVPENNLVKMGVMETKYKDTNASGTNYMTLTDKETYLVIIGYWHDENQKSWVAASSKPTFDDDVKEKILTHIESFGFDRKLAYEIDYSSCPETKLDDDEADNNVKTEL